jgi:hypothetical protein
VFGSFTEGLHTDIEIQKRLTLLEIFPTKKSPFSWWSLAGVTVEKE